MKSPVYICYDANQKKYLIEHGERYYVCGLNPTNKRTFWVFMRNDKLNDLITEWNR
ncbi:hypothetical protein [Terrisporobacter sp.]|uniref:hypothetical protein n=1 Tax=Terrisporobacter sp. TaxID=1965305 RepID=UPI002633AF10|nr:hypothetical protein [Terrisporobacter sp.]